MKEVALVTGVAGFIGSHLAERLVQSGYQVIGLDNLDDYYSRNIKRDNIQALQTVENFRFEEGDIRDTTLLSLSGREHWRNCKSTRD
jgi:UDP-glucuronate 4-epimerase